MSLEISSKPACGEVVHVSLCGRYWRRMATAIAPYGLLTHFRECRMAEKKDTAAIKKWDCIATTTYSLFLWSKSRATSHGTIYSTNKFSSYQGGFGTRCQQHRSTAWPSYAWMATCTNQPWMSW